MAGGLGYVRGSPGRPFGTVEWKRSCYGTSDEKNHRYGRVTYARLDDDKGLCATQILHRLLGIVRRLGEDALCQLTSSSMPLSKF